RRPARQWPLLLATMLLAALVLLPPGAERPGEAAGGASQGVAPGALTVLAAGDLRGEIKPCGCSPEGQMGGLPRRLSYLGHALRATGPDPALRPILVDLGNNLPAATEQGRFKIDLIRTLLRQFTPDAVLPGPGELALGSHALQGGLPFVVSNDVGGQVFPAVRTVQRGGRRVGIYGYLSPGVVYQGPHEALALRPADAALLEEWRRRIAVRHDDATVLLFRGDDAELATLAKARLFDLIVAGNPFDDELHQVTERKVAGLRIPQVPTKGQGVLRLTLPPPGPPGRESAPPAPVDWLTDTWPDHPAAAPVFAAYDEQVKSLFFARLEAQQQQTQTSPYAGVATCQPCHAPQQAIWAASRHSHALATLEKVGKQYDPECLACHVVGLQRGGYLSQDVTPQFANVQCESCHGPSKAHVAMPQHKTGPPPTLDGTTLVRPAEQTCRTCHRGSHSPKFDFAVYWPKIAHLTSTVQQAQR
ncbi:MAG TPA: cytochrome c family protein, partial [bacterium]